MRSRRDPTTVAALVPDPQNRRTHNARNIEMIAAALRSVGAARSIVIDEGDTVLAGNGVLEGAARAGITKVQVVEAEGDTIIAVRRRGLSAAQKRELAIYDNRTAELAEWNADQLAVDLAAGEDLTPFFFDGELKALLGQAVKPGRTDPDAVPAARATPIVLGDLFELGEHRLLCADSTLSVNVERVMREVNADLVFTDPPYGMNLDTDFSGMVGLGQGNVYRAIAGDQQPYDPGHIFETFPRCQEIVLWGADYYAERIPRRNAGSWFVWDKANGGDAPNDDYDKMFGSNFELAWSRTKHKRALVRILWKGFFGLSQEDTKRRVHPTQKPTELARWFFDRFTKKGDCVVDLFLGSGSSLIAAAQIDRRCVALEVDPSYCQVIIDRWEAFTGQTAVKVGEAVRA